MKQIWSKSLACLLCLALLVGMLPMAALAEDNPPAPANDEVSLLSTQENVSYIDPTDESDRNKTCLSATVVTESDATWSGDNNGGWYVVNGNVPISSRVTVTGNVHLILADECSLTVNGGINVGSDNSLTIYGQAEGTGALSAEGGENSLSNQAGIGGGPGQSGGAVTINGGTVNATGYHGAGIGGGAADLAGGAGGSITINGGTVMATSRNGAGIGGGRTGAGGSITINGGTVTATCAGTAGAGIGGGDGGAGGIIHITGGTVRATGGNLMGAGIGGGQRGEGGTIIISGGIVTATGGTGGAGIGGGASGGGGSITISGGTVTATGGASGAGIGGGFRGDIGSFSTGDNGNAVIIADGKDGNEISADGNTDSWSGVIFQGKDGAVYGTGIAPIEDFTIPEGATLTIEDGKTLTISQGVTLTNNGTITVDGGTLINNGSINGAVQLNGGSTIQTGDGPAITIGKDTTGATVGTGGSVTLPNGGSATIGSDGDTTTITTSQGGEIKPARDGSVTVPGGSTVQTGENGPKITIGNDGATVGNDGGVTLPENGNVTIGSGDDTTTITTPGGGTIKPNDDGSVTIPGGSTVQTGDGTSITFPPEGGTLGQDGTVVYIVTVTFNSQGGSEVASKDINVNNPVEEPAAPTRSGYSFHGWYTAASGGERWDFTKPVAADMTLYAQWSWINVGGPTYPPTMDEPENGAVTTSPSRPEKGDAVTITPKPDEGFEVDEILVKDEDGNEIEVTQNPDGTYTFTQPDGKVTITVTFRCDGGELCPGHHLTDVSKDAWYHAAVDYVVAHGIMEGMSETEFAPATALTRAMAVQILYNLEGQPDLSDENLGYPYKDVDAQAWYGNAVYWARITGVATGYGDGTFQPGGSITRQEFAQMLYNYAKYKGYDLTAEGDLSQFPDSGSVANWAEAAMSWANGNELINGHDNGTIDAAGTAIRAQAASILMRFDENVTE